MIFMAIVCLAFCVLGIIVNIFVDKEYIERTPTGRMIGVVLGIMEFVVLINAIRLFANQ